jgi:hypothetical protein
MLCGGVGAHCTVFCQGDQHSDACIARNVIPRLGPPVCCVQYAGREDTIAANADCIP